MYHYKVALAARCLWIAARRADRPTVESVEVMA